MKIFWAKLEFIGISFIALGFLAFGLQFTGRWPWLNTRRTLMLSIPLVLNILLAFTNENHQQIWTDIQFANDQPFGPLALQHGLYFFVSSAYIYGLIIVTGALLFQIAISEQSLYANQARIMIAGIVIPLVANFLYISGQNPFPEIDLSPIAISLTNAFIAIGFVRYKFMDILPVAHNLVFSAMSDGVIVVDDKNRIADINPAAKWLFPKHGDFIGRSVLEIFPEWETWQAARQPGGGLAQELSIETSEGLRTFKLRSAELEIPRQVQRLQVVILSDVTELELARRAAIEANTTKTRMLANISHDLRSPLGTVIGYAEMLKSGAFGTLEPEQENASSEILDSANQLLNFVNNLIGQAQIETGRVLLQKRPFEVDELIGPLLSTLTFHAKKKNLTLESQIDPQLPSELLGDSYWLRQIVLNLVNNAIKFTESGTVKVTFLRLDAEQWAIQVQDTGVGIPQEAREAVFEAFKQLDSHGARKQPGSGLGLSIVRELAAAMNGRVELERQPGVGSTFTVIMPLMAP